MTAQDLVDELRSAVRGYLAPREPSSVGTDAYTGWTPAEWRALAVDLGLAGVSVDDADGGLGLGAEVQAMVHGELGRVLHQGPYLSTVAGALPMLQAAGRTELVAGIAAGSLVFGAVASPDPEWPVLASAADGVSGTLPLVRDVTAPDGLVVAVTLDGDPAVIRVDPTQQGVTVTPVETVDVTRPLHRVRLDAAGVDVLSTGADARQAAQAAGTAMALALAADSVGVAERALELTVSYVAQRRQFDRPIGSFQGIKHQCADLLVSVELARAALELALAPGEVHSAAATAIARIQCGRSAWEVAESAVHLHGGIGFTWEHRIQLYYRRAKTNELLLAAGAAQHDAIVDVLTGA